ncbi:MAG: flagellar hook protein FlgE [Selenomonadaceae bacterium]|nr:flagellar hook protein FlgE [Selenomonadaceae bacterium]
MMRSVFAGVSGLKNHQTRMDVIGNNISNVNTTGFKSSRVTFVDTLSQTMSGAASPKTNIGGTNPKQVGLGSSVGSIDLMFQDGSVQSTGKNTDLCITGNGLFVVKNGNEKYYTRDGAFEFDAEGNYVLPGSGLFVQGWMGKDGVVDTTTSPGNITVAAGKSMSAKPTDLVSYANNLNASIPMVTELVQEDDQGIPQSVDDVTATSDKPVTVTLSDGSTIIQTNGTYHKGNSMPITTTVNIYDSLGGTHEIPLYFVRQGTISTATSSTTATAITSLDKWVVSLEPDATKAQNADSTYSFIEENGTETTVTMPAAMIQFTSSGKLVTAPGSLSPAPDSNKQAELVYTLGSIGTTGTTPTTPTTQKVMIDFTALTQFTGNNTINGTSNGNSAGTLKEIQIDTSGVITGVYTNGVRQAEAQVAIAQFTNATGLTKTGNSLYQESNNSGQANVKTAADLGVSITPSALEMSNVDIANEFADMIVTQRGFQSNSKIVTVGDEMLETIINMKR